MKAKKAIKRLHRVDTLLGTVIDEYDAGTSGVKDMLSAARSKIASASQALAASPAAKAPAKADSAQKRLPIAAKKRGAAANHAKPSHKLSTVHSAAVAS
jgi:ParB-like chromosome segregation protein Spo0J